MDFFHSHCSVRILVVLLMVGFVFQIAICHWFKPWTREEINVIIMLVGSPDQQCNVKVVCLLSFLPGPWP